jgi:hypothetical protein
VFAVTQLAHRLVLLPSSMCSAQAVPLSWSEPPTTNRWLSGVAVSGFGPTLLTPPV